MDSGTVYLYGIIKKRYRVCNGTRYLSEVSGSQLYDLAAAFPLLQRVSASHALVNSINSPTVIAMNP